MSDVGMGAEVRTTLNRQSIGVGAVVEGDIRVAVEEAEGVVDDGIGLESVDGNVGCSRVGGQGGHGRARC